MSFFLKLLSFRNTKDHSTVLSVYTAQSFLPVEDSSQVPNQVLLSPILCCLADLRLPTVSLQLKIRPHRFGGEGVLIGVQFGYTKCSSHICLYSSRYISFSWGGGAL